MKYRSIVLIDHGRLDYEIRNHGQAVVGIPSGVHQSEIDDAVIILKQKYRSVTFDDLGDIIVSDERG